MSRANDSRRASRHAHQRALAKIWEQYPDIHRIYCALYAQELRGVRRDAQREAAKNGVAS